MDSSHEVHPLWDDHMELLDLFIHKLWASGGRRLILHPGDAHRLLWGSVCGWLELVDLITYFFACHPLPLSQPPHWAIDSPTPHWTFCCIENNLLSFPHISLWIVFSIILFPQVSFSCQTQELCRLNYVLNKSVPSELRLCKRTLLMKLGEQLMHWVASLTT